MNFGSQGGGFQQWSPTSQMFQLPTQPPAPGAMRSGGIAYHGTPGAGSGFRAPSQPAQQGQPAQPGIGMPMFQQQPPQPGAMHYGGPQYSSQQTHDRMMPAGRQTTQGYAAGASMGRQMGTGWMPSNAGNAGAV
jgi:hypothetical protein